MATNDFVPCCHPTGLSPGGEGLTRIVCLLSCHAPEEDKGPAFTLSWLFRLLALEVSLVTLNKQT